MQPPCWCWALELLRSMLQGMDCGRLLQPVSRRSLSDVWGGEVAWLWEMRFDQDVKWMPVQ